MYNIYESLLKAAEKSPNKTAVIDEYGPLSYAELVTQINELQNQLSQQGISKGKAIGVLASNNRHFIICLYASVATGALTMPIATQQKPHEIHQSIETAQLHGVVGNEDFGAIPNIQHTEQLTEKYHFSSIERDAAELNIPFEENPAFMRFTSGTTGNAKGVVISHNAILERIEAANAVMKINDNDKILWVFPMAFHFMVSIVLYLKSGATIIINNDFLADSILQSIQEHQATFLYCSPLHIKLLAATTNCTSLESLRYVVSTTTGASARDCKLFEDKYQLPVHQAFGIIEVGLPIINDKSASNRPSAVGRALPDYQIEILDTTTFTPKESGTVGLLGIKGPGMFSGYLTSNQSRSSVEQNGWFITGDLASKDKTGLITIQGREKNLIIVHGNKVFPNEVEEIIYEYPNITKCKVMGQQHALLGEIVAAEIVASSKVNVEDLIQHCRHYLSPYKIPQKITQVDEIEMTASGKIKRS